MAGRPGKQGACQLPLAHPLALAVEPDVGSRDDPALLAGELGVLGNRAVGFEVQVALDGEMEATRG